VQHPVPITNPLINYIVLTLAIIFEGGALYFAAKEFHLVKGRMGYIEAVQRAKDPATFVVLFEDTAAMAGLLIALVGILISQVTGNPVYDGIASILIGVVLAVTAAWLAYETKGLLIGESARECVRRKITDIAKHVPWIEHVNEVLTLHMGPAYILVNMSVDMKNSAPVGEIEKAIARLDHEIKTAFPEVKRIFVEAEARRRPPMDFDPDSDREFSDAHQMTFPSSG
jgi:divalent metal cation (Fe/Co/Zn/Cd) transporter